MRKLAGWSVVSFFRGKEDLGLRCRTEVFEKIELSAGVAVIAHLLVEK